MIKVANASTSKTNFYNQIRVQDYYNKDWNLILRPKSQYVSAMVYMANQICKNKYIGYSQTQRLSLYNTARYYDFNFENIDEYCYCDCSSFVATILKAIGYNLNISEITTSTMRSIFVSLGFKAIDFTDESQLKKGDILVKEGSHCIMVIDVKEDNTSDTKQYGIVKLKNTTSYLNVRKSPTTDSQVIGTLDHNDRVEILGKEKGWYYIRFEDIKGYCSRAYITLV